jgi:prevent-host-death family protein
MIQQQTKILPASEVKNNFGAIASQVRNGEYKEVIVENRGQPIVAIVGVEELQDMRAFREKKRREEALALLRQTRKEAQDQSKGKLTSEEVKTLANRFGRELVEELEKEGKVRFERKSP